MQGSQRAVRESFPLPSTPEVDHHLETKLPGTLSQITYVILEAENMMLNK